MSTKLSSLTGNHDARETEATLVPVSEFLRRHAPFDRFTPADLHFLSSRVSLGFHARGEIITGPDSGPAETFYIIKQGRVRGESANGPRHTIRKASAPTGATGPARGPRRDDGGADANVAAEDGAWELVEGECFPIGALLAHRPVHTVHRAVEDSFCFELARADFDRLLKDSEVFHDFCTRRIANLLDQALSQAQAGLAARASGDAALNAPLASLIRRAPVSCAPRTPLREALARMQAERVGSIVAVDDQDRPLGMFTLHDLLARVAVEARAGLDDPLEAVMTRDPLCLPRTAYAYEAALLMAREGIGHLCVVDRERVVGVVSERDLFALQRIGLVHLSRAIGEAGDVAALARLGRDTHRLVDQMLLQGASVVQITQLITELNDQLTRRVIELVRAEHGDPGVEFTWLAFGSEGRLEQTLKTDQDNGILFEAAGDVSATRARLLAFARQVNEALDAIGFPLCKGNVMASNPECCLTAAEWAARFDRWIDAGAPKDLLQVSIYFDFRSLEGPTAAVERLRERVAERAAGTPRFLRQLAENVLGNTPPLGLMRDFVVEARGEHAHMIDLKLRGAMPFVDGARLFALANRLGETNTIARLQAAAERGAMPVAEAEAWCDAYGFIQLLRMRAHQRAERAGRPLDNHVDPDRLNDLDRRILKEAFRQARKLQSRIALDYQI